ncbi:MAG: DUF177 domain-containing protein [Thermodesulfobacteriota bacterium]
MRIRFEDIPDQGLTVSLDDPSWLPGDELTVQGPIRARLHLERRGERVLCDLELVLSLILACDRCLGPLVLPVDERVQLVLEVAGAPEPDLGGGPEEEEDTDTVLLEEPVVEVESLLRQQLFLALPQKRLCADDCPGLCPVCGANRRLQACHCRPEIGRSPFAALATLAKGSGPGKD